MSFKTLLELLVGSLIAGAAGSLVFFVLGWWWTRRELRSTWRDALADMFKAPEKHPKTGDNEFKAVPAVFEPYADVPWLVESPHERIGVFFAQLPPPDVERIAEFLEKFGDEGNAPVRVSHLSIESPTVSWSAQEQIDAVFRRRQQLSRLVLVE